MFVSCQYACAYKNMWIVSQPFLTCLTKSWLDRELTHQQTIYNRWKKKKKCAQFSCFTALQLESSQSGFHVQIWDKKKPVDLKAVDTGNGYRSMGSITAALQDKIAF